jgi:hypothetical protein
MADERDERVYNMSVTWTNVWRKLASLWTFKYHTSYYLFIIDHEITIHSKRNIFWDIMPCSPLRVNRRFEETYHLHLQCQRINRARNHPENMWQVELCLFPLFFHPEQKGNMFLRNVVWLSADYTVLYPRRQLFITTAKRTSDPTSHSFFNVANVFSFIHIIFIFKITSHASSPYLPVVQDGFVYSAIVPHELVREEAVPFPSILGSVLSLRSAHKITPDFLPE